MKHAFDLIHRKKVIQFASGVLITIVAGLVVSALLANTPADTKPKTKKPCEDWFKSLSRSQKDHLADVFQTALTASATDKTLRKKLLTKRGCYKIPKQTIQGRLDSAYPDDKTKFPEDTLMVFYEAEGSLSAHLAATPQPWYPNEHCLHIFYLPPEGPLNTNDKPTFKYNLKCCYEPW